MADWQTANTGAFIPPALDTLIDSAGSVASSASSVLATIQAAIDLLKNFVIGVPAFDWLGSLAQEIEDFKTDFLATGMFSLNMWDYPIFQFRNRGAVSGESFSSSFEADVIAALADTSDPNRPDFTSDAAALLLVGAVSETGAALTLLRSVRDAFTWWQEIAETADQLSRINVESQVREVEEAIKRGDIVFSTNPSEQTIQLLALQVALQEAKDNISSDAFETNIEPSVPTTSSTPQQIQQFISTVNQQVENPPYPNFQQISLRTIIPGLQEAFDRALDPLVAALASGKSIVDTIESFVAALQEKIDGLDAIVTTINDILAQLDGVLNLTGLNALFVTTSDGVDGLADEIQNAGSKPLEGSTGYYTGLVLVSGGPNVTAFETLFGPIGGS